MLFLDLLLITEELLLLVAGLFEIAINYSAFQRL